MHEEVKGETDGTRQKEGGALKEPTWLRHQRSQDGSNASQPTNTRPGGKQTILVCKREKTGDVAGQVDKVNDSPAGREATKTKAAMLVSQKKNLGRCAQQRVLVNGVVVSGGNLRRRGPSGDKRWELKPGTPSRGSRGMLRRQQTLQNQEN